MAIVLTIPSRRDNVYLPSRPVVKQKGHCTLPSRPVEKIHTHRPVPSHPGNYNFHYFTVPSSIFFQPNMSKQYRPVPSRILPAMKSLGYFPPIPSMKYQSFRVGLLRGLGKRKFCFCCSNNTCDNMALFGVRNICVLAELHADLFSRKLVL